MRIIHREKNLRLEAESKLYSGLVFKKSRYSKIPGLYRNVEFKKSKSGERFPRRYNGFRE